MKYAVGYQLPEGNESPFSDLVEQYADSISEVYFPWLDIPSGRSAIASRHGYTDWSAQKKLVFDLRTIKSLGKKLDLLLNANCYGRLAISEQLRNQIVSIIDYIGSFVGDLDIVTTTSPFIAEVVKKAFPQVEIRASVNMWVGTIKSMQYLSDLFDSFYLQREYNRNITYIRELRKWCDSKGKGLCMLANSGCLNYCTGHSFHDNLVAHESEICETLNVAGFEPYTCWRYLKKRENWVVLLQNSWVRPEDIHNYEELFSTVKLATRMHSHPGMVLDAYSRGSYQGNVLDLCEPGFGPALAPWIIDNKRIPKEFFEHTSQCDRRCHECKYCETVLNDSLLKIEMSE